MVGKVLIVDDEPQILNLFVKALIKWNYTVATAADAATAKEQLTNSSFQVALLDLNLPDATGLELLEYIKINQPNCSCIIMTGYGTTKIAVQAIRMGAFDYIEKPFDSLNQVKEIINRAVTFPDTVNMAVNWEPIKQLADQVGMIIGQSEEMKRLVATAYKIAGKKVSVLITGETGTGKEMLARFIHAASRRNNHVFIPVNCGAIHQSLLESELFGHEKGAFTGAIGVKRGVFELAHQGTLFLDELAEASHEVQIKLLRVLESGEFVRLGGEKSISSDVRIIAATNSDIERLVKQKKFREDLFYRLDVVRLELPPLRQRVADIPQLVEFFTNKISHFNPKGIPKCSSEAMAFLMTHPWYGNIRELYNAIQQILARDIRGQIAKEDLPVKLLQVGNGQTHGQLSPGDEEQSRSPQQIIALLYKIEGKLDQIKQPTEKVDSFVPRPLHEVEKEHVEKTIAYYNGNMTLAAKALGINRATLYRKLKQ